MSRVIHADVITELAKDHFNTAFLVKIDFATAVYLTDYAHDITHSSITYDAGGHLLGISSVSETSEVRVGSITINLSGVQQAHIATLLSGGYVDRQVVISRVVLNDVGVIIGNPITVYDGRISHFAISDTDESSEINLTVTSHWADFELKAGRRTNDNSQQMFFSGDKGLEFSGLMTKDIKWGRL